MMLPWQIKNLINEYEKTRKSLLLAIQRDVARALEHPDEEFARPLSNIYATLLYLESAMRELRRTITE